MLFCEVCDHEGTEQLRYTKEIYVRKDGLKQMLAIKKIYMDYETAPVGVSHMPQFAWELVSDKKNVKQSLRNLHMFMQKVLLWRAASAILSVQKPVMVRKKRTGAKPHPL